MDILDLNEMDEITGKIWLGNKIASTHYNLLKKNGIKKIISLLDFPVEYNKEEESDFIRKVIIILDYPSKNISLLSKYYLILIILYKKIS